MKPMNRRIHALGRSFLCAVLSSLASCEHPGNLRRRMEIAARPRAGVEQTQLAHIGQVITDEGTFQVAIQRRILADMAAPRGLVIRLLLFDLSGTLVSSFDSAFSTGGEPLWCEDSRVYLHGFCSWNVGDTLRAVEADPRILEHKGRFRFGNPCPDSVTGNVLDFQSGPTKPLLTREKKYGSSGGIEDDPWELAEPEQLNIE